MTAFRFPDETNGRTLTLQNPLAITAIYARRRLLMDKYNPLDFLTIATQGGPILVNPRRRFQPAAILGGRGERFLAGITAWDGVLSVQIDRPRVRCTVIHCPPN